MQTSSLWRYQFAVFSSSQGNAYTWVIFCSSEVHVCQGKLPLFLIILMMEFTFLRLKFTLIQKSTYTIQILLPFQWHSWDSLFGELHNTDLVLPLHVQTWTLLLKWRMLQILMVNIHPRVIWASRGQFSAAVVILWLFQLPLAIVWSPDTSTESQIKVLLKAIETFVIFEDRLVLIQVRNSWNSWKIK